MRGYVMHEVKSFKKGECYSLEKYVNNGWQHEMNVFFLDIKGLDVSFMTLEGAEMLDLSEYGKVFRFVPPVYDRYPTKEFCYEELLTILSSLGCTENVELVAERLLSEFYERTESFIDSDLEVSIIKELLENS